MGGSGNVIASCNCNYLDFQLTIASGQYIDLSYQPCNGEVTQTIRYTSSTTVNQGICIAERNYNFSGTGTVNSFNLDRVCLETNCQSCSCYEFFYQTSTAPETYIRYVPCNQPSSSAITIGPFAPLSTGSFVCSFPWAVMPISGAIDYNDNGPSGVIKQVNSGSCQPIVSGSLQVGDLRGGGMIIYVTGSYPNQNGLIITTASVATSSVLPATNRWGFYGTITNINNKAYGTGASNTLALRNYIPATGSIAANAFTASINGYNDWFLPSVSESFASTTNNIQWPVQWAAQSGVQSNYLLSNQPQIWRITKGNSILTSNEIGTEGTTANREQRNYIVGTTIANNLASITKDTTGPFWGYRYFTSSLVP